VDSLEVLPAAERDRVLYEWNQTRSEYPSDKCVHELFEAQVEKTPDGIAVVFEEEELRYAELNRRANQLAHRLRELGVGPDRRVAICAERSFEMVIALLAVLKAGAAYLPVDPDYPADRVGFMLADAGPVLAVVQGSTAALVPDGVPAVVVDDPAAAALNASAASMTACARGSSSVPDAVKKTRRVDRSMSWVPRPVSSAANACDNVDWLTPRVVAALLNCRFSATATNARSPAIVG